MLGCPGRTRVGDPVGVRELCYGAKYTLDSVRCNCTRLEVALRCGCGLWSLVVEPITSCPQNIFPTPSHGISASTPSTTAVCPITYTASPVSSLPHLQKHLFQQSIHPSRCLSLPSPTLPSRPTMYAMILFFSSFSPIALRPRLRDCLGAMASESRDLPLATMQSSILRPTLMDSFAFRPSSIG